MKKKLACLGIAVVMLFGSFVFMGCRDEFVSIWFDISSYAWFEVDDGTVIPVLNSGLMRSREALERRADEAINMRGVDGQTITAPSMRIWELIEGRWDDDFFENYSLFILVQTYSLIPPIEILVRFGQQLILCFGYGFSCSCNSVSICIEKNCACYFFISQPSIQHSHVSFIQIRKHDVASVVGPASGRLNTIPICEI